MSLCGKLYPSFAPSRASTQNEASFKTYAAKGSILSADDYAPATRSELQFAQPVEIGSLLLLDSKVTFSPMQGEHHSFHVSVEGESSLQVSLFTSLVC